MPESIPEEAKDFIRSLLVRHGAQRLALHRVVQHPFLLKYYYAPNNISPPTMKNVVVVKVHQGLCQLRNVSSSGGGRVFLYFIELAVEHPVAAGLHDQVDEFVVEEVRVRAEEVFVAAVERDFNFSAQLPDDVVLNELRDFEPFDGNHHIAVANASEEHGAVIPTAEPMQELEVVNSPLRLRKRWYNKEITNDLRFIIAGHSFDSNFRFGCRSKAPEKRCTTLLFVTPSGHQNDCSTFIGCIRSRSI